MNDSAMVTVPCLVTVAAGAFAPGHLGELTRYLPFELVDDVLEMTGSEHARGDRDQALHGHHGTIIQGSSCEGSKVMSQSLDLQELRRIHRAAHNPKPERDRYRLTANAQR